MLYCRHHDLALCPEHKDQCLGGNRCNPIEDPVAEFCSVCSGIMALKRTDIKGRFIAYRIDKGFVYEYTCETCAYKFTSTAPTTSAPAICYRCLHGESVKEILGGLRKIKYRKKKRQGVENEVVVPSVRQVTDTEQNLKGVANAADSEASSEAEDHKYPDADFQA